MTRWLVLFAALAQVFFAPLAHAHEVRPAYLEITQVSRTTYRVMWKLPTMGDVAIHLEPRLSNGWLDRAPSDQYAAAGYLIRSWTIADKRPDAVFGQTVTIDGLPDTMTDVFLRIRLLDGRHVDAILRPEQPALRIGLVNGNEIALPSFLLLGIEHILTGPDHLLFVLGLLLIVRGRWALIKTVSAFTLAHSITLAAATLGLIQLSVPLLNALIALSILFLAPEVVRARRGGTSLTIRYPWIVAFVFGLLHGMGFASGLTALGLERGPLAGALLLFNAGVEIGQLAFIAVILALLRALRLMEWHWPRAFAAAPTYTIGILGAFWTIQYSAILFGVI